MIDRTIDEESFFNIMMRWQHVQDEDGWRDILYLHTDKLCEEDEVGGYYFGSDLRIWETYRRTASSPSLGAIRGFGKP